MNFNYYPTEQANLSPQKQKLTKLDSFSFSISKQETHTNYYNFDLPEIQLYQDQSFEISEENDLSNYNNELKLEQKDSSFNFNNMKNTLNLNKSMNKFSFEDLERKVSKSCGGGFSRIMDEYAQSNNRKLTKYSALQAYHTADADLSIPSLNKKIKKTKVIKKKVRVKKRKSNKYKKMKKVLLQKTSSKIFSTFAMEFEDIFSLYPSLTNFNQTRNFSTFPKMFASGDNFCQSKANKKMYKKTGSLNSDSTGLSEDNPEFNNVKSTLVRSKVDNLKGSMLCFEFNQNLKEMIELSKCMKWNRRREYRTEMAKRGVKEFDDEAMELEC